MSFLCTNLFSAVVIAIAVCTAFELWKHRYNLFKDELDDDTRSLAWRVVLFLVFPLIVWMDLRATVVSAEHFGGWIQDWNYGLLWFSAIPHSLPHADLLVPVLFAGVVMQLLLAVCLLPSLFFRPHPFIASIITYTIGIILANNLIVDPLLGLAGAGSSRWQLCFTSLPKDYLVLILGVYACFTAGFFLGMRSKRVRIWFADLTSPVLAEQLRIAISETNIDRSNQYQLCRLTILFDRAGMRSNAAKELASLKKLDAEGLYALLAEGLFQYRRREYEKSEFAFKKAALLPEVNDVLRAQFFSAAACAAFAKGKIPVSLNFADRALEFDNNSVVARMVKVDAYLKQGKKEQAGDEVLNALRLGLDFEIEEKLPIDTEMALRQIFRLEKAAAAKRKDSKEIAVP